MRPADEVDVRLDSLALVEACHHDDLRCARVLLDNANTRLVAMFLARLTCDLLEGWTEDPAEAFAWLRENHGAA